MQAAVARRKEPVTLPCGRPASLGSRPGRAPGARAGLAGTLSVPSWPGEWAEPGSGWGLVRVEE